MAVPVAAKDTETIVISCRPCNPEGPEEPFGYPLCDDFEMNTSLIEAAERSDASAIELLRTRFRTTISIRERHRMAAALARVQDDDAFWKELLEEASWVVRIPRRNGELTNEFRFYSKGLGKPEDVWDMGFHALISVAEDPRSRDLLIQALATDDIDLIATAAYGLGGQQDHASLPKIEAALERFPDDAMQLVVGLSLFKTEEADRIAMRFLTHEDDRALYFEWKRDLR